MKIIVAISQVSQPNAHSNFILSAFDWARQVQVTPLRLEYVQQKEYELFNRLLAFANKKQEEIRLLISQTMIEMREELIRAAVDYDIFRKFLLISFLLSR
jgi:hypothetical protein